MSRKSLKTVRNQCLSHTKNFETQERAKFTPCPHTPNEVKTAQLVVGWLKCKHVGDVFGSLERFPTHTNMRPCSKSANFGPCEFNRNPHEHSRKQLEIHLQACRRRFWKFGAICDTYQYPPRPKPRLFAQNHRDPHERSRKQSETIYKHVRLLGTTGALQNPWNHCGTTRTTWNRWNHLGTTGTILEPLEPFRHPWDHCITTETTSKPPYHVETSGTLLNAWTTGTISESFEPFWRHWNHFRALEQCWNP